MKYTEAEVQGLKAQDAKNYCIELMHQLNAKESGPISPTSDSTGPRAGCRWGGRFLTTRGI